MENSDSIDLRRTTLLTERKDLLFKQPSRIALALFLSWISIAQAADFTESVVSVLNGDTIEVMHNTHPERVRLSGIDCPEKGQPYGKHAKQAASALVFVKDITIQTHGHDKYQRTLGDVILPEGMIVNHTLVKDGWGRWYWKCAPGDTVLEGLEREAREAKRGMWADYVRPDHVRDQYRTPDTDLPPLLDAG